MKIYEATSSIVVYYSPPRGNAIKDKNPDFEAEVPVIIFFKSLSA